MFTSARFFPLHNSLSDNNTLIRHRTICAYRSGAPATGSFNLFRRRPNQYRLPVQLSGRPVPPPLLLTPRHHPDHCTRHTGSPHLLPSTLPRAWAPNTPSHIGAHHRIVGTTSPIALSHVHTSSDAVAHHQSSSRGGATVGLRHYLFFQFLSPDRLSSACIIINRVLQCCARVMILNNYRSAARTSELGTAAAGGGRFAAIFNFSRRILCIAAAGRQQLSTTSTAIIIIDKYYPPDYNFIPF